MTIGGRQAPLASQSAKRANRKREPPKHDGQSHGAEHFTPIIRSAPPMHVRGSGAATGSTAHRGQSVERGPRETHDCVRGSLRGRNKAMRGPVIYITNPNEGNDFAGRGHPGVWRVNSAAVAHAPHRAGT